jgi:proteasome lid subunit RPN8/RPN11
LSPVAEPLAMVDMSNLPARKCNRLSGSRTADFQIIIARSALDIIQSHGNASPNVEICGVLMGDVYRDNTGSYVLIDNIVRGNSASGSAGQVTFTAEIWQDIQTVVDRDFPNLRIVGWYHTHPGHGIFLSEMDLFIQQSFFDQRWQTALVYDPQNVETGIFGWVLDKTQKREYLIEEEEDTSMTTLNAEANADVLERTAEPTYIGPTTAIPHPWQVKPTKSRSLPTKIFLSFVVWGMFALLGLLAAMIFHSMHVELPKLPLH